jgi:hypothetical protein
MLNPYRWVANQRGPGLHLDIGGVRSTYKQGCWHKFCALSNVMPYSVVRTSFVATKRQRANIERYKGRVRIPHDKAVRESGLPKSSWWLEGNFAERAKKEEPRMRRSTLGRSPFDRLAG